MNEDETHEEAIAAAAKKVEDNLEDWERELLSGSVYVDPARAGVGGYLDPRKKAEARVAALRRNLKNAENRIVTLNEALAKEGFPIEQETNPDNLPLWYRVREAMIGPTTKINTSIWIEVKSLEDQTKVAKDPSIAALVVIEGVRADPSTAGKVLTQITNGIAQIVSEQPDA